MDLGPHFVDRIGRLQHAKRTQLATTYLRFFHGSEPKPHSTCRPNNLGYAKVWYRDGDTYREGISDRRGQMVIPLLSEMLVQDITGNLALIQFERKFLFVPLDQGPYSREDFEEVVGFQYAMPINVAWR